MNTQYFLSSQSINEIIRLHSVLPSPITDYIGKQDKLITQTIAGFIKESAILSELQQTISDKLYHTDQDGWIAFDLTPFLNHNELLLNIATVFCFLAGKPFKLNEEAFFWEPLTVNLKAVPNRTHGVGDNPFHIDLVNRMYPPELIAFFGIRADPLGGGYTELAHLAHAVSKLNKREIDLLRQPIFKYWKDENVVNVGHHLNYYSILPDDIEQGYIRYTAKMLPHLNENSASVLIKNALHLAPKIKIILVKLQSHLLENKIRLLVDCNHLLIFNQRRLVHSRTALGAGQAACPENTRRLLLQAYMHRY